MLKRLIYLNGVSMARSTKDLGRDNKSHDTSQVQIDKMYNFDVKLAKYSLIK